MREIEVKAKLRNKDSFLIAATKLGMTFGEPTVQDDTVYECNLPYEDPHWNIFRIRDQDGTLILTMKHKASDRPRDNHEYETIIEDATEVAKMLERLGFSKGVRIRKQRRIAHYNDLEICLDEVDELGSFVEVEKLADDDADVDAVQTELWALLVQLGVSADDRVTKGYDTLMYDLKSQ